MTLLAAHQGVSVMARFMSWGGEIFHGDIGDRGLFSVCGGGGEEKGERDTVCLHNAPLTPKNIPQHPIGIPTDLFFHLFVCLFIFNLE